MAKNYNRTLSEDEFKDVLKTGMILLGTSFVFMAAMAAMVHTDTIRLYPKSVDQGSVKDIPGKIEFALRYQTLLVAWLAFNVIATIYGRVSTKAINPLDASLEHNVNMVKQILTNSFEQIVLSVFAQLVFISFAPAECVLKAIPLVNLIQFIGRIAFYYGYPYKRSFGFSCTAMPTLVLVVYDIYSFAMYLGK